jgi:hypothetical protein
MTTHHDLRLALYTAFLHCTPGGLALFVPDHVRETLEPTTDGEPFEAPKWRARWVESMEP